MNDLFRQMIIKAAEGYDVETNKNKILELIFSEEKEKLIRRQSYLYDYSSIKPKGDEGQFKKFDFDNRMKDKLLKVVRNATEYGIGGMLERFPNSNKLMVQNVHILKEPITYNEVLTEAYLSVDYVDLNSYDEQDTQIMKLWLNEEGKYVLSYMDIPVKDDEVYVLEDGKVQKVIKDDEEYKREYVYADIDHCPLHILENNESAKGDWTYASERLRLFAKFDSIIEKEWEYLKVQMLNNLVGGSDKTGEQVQQDIEKGEKRVHDITDIDGLGDTSLSILSAGGITAEIARTIKVNYKEEVDELTFSIGQLSGGNNKHTTEAIMSNLDAFKYMYVKMEYFQHFLSELYTAIAKSYSLVNQEMKQRDFVEMEVKFSKVIEMVLTSAQETNTPKPMKQPIPETE